MFFFKKNDIDKCPYFTKRQDENIKSVNLFT